MGKITVPYGTYGDFRTHPTSLHPTHPVNLLSCQRDVSCFQCSY